ncbi:Y4yA family PLP-dependent enzyme [Pseudonocardia eucalypti]|uniref:Y4yA family PLP-dependent enzyme n=1 Tax=Pseudonocardia eucalypti TaxID=648755 RepID=A0ABP9QAQ3_9PSEU|nr:diaminopimelate decarboxylase [Pseudonocardia eucalypti]
MELTQAPLAPSLPAVEPPWARRARADPALLADIAHAVGGPFHVLHPEQFARRLRAFNAALAGAGVTGQVFYGKKANRSACWLAGCVAEGAGVDVASVPELVDALAGGVRGEDLVVTGAAKATELLWLAARHGALVAVDALDELERIVALARSAGPPRVLLRVLPETTDPHSRFGLSEDELDRALERCAAAPGIRMEGFSFHLGGYRVAPRAALAARLVDRCVAARARGMAATSISIGGGFAVSYVDASDWARFQRDYRDDWFHAGKRFTGFYPYHQSPTGADMLSEILAEVGPAFVRTGTRMLLEPGRALLDGAGFTVFPVQGYKARNGYGIVTVAGLSASVSEQWKGSEFLPEPVLWPAGNGDPVIACVGGSSCLEYDMLSWRKIPFPRPPKHGDLLVYPNTAGYQMDKNETRFHQLPLPARVELTESGNGFRWRYGS